MHIRNFSLFAAGMFLSLIDLGAGVVPAALVSGGAAYAQTNPNTALPAPSVDQTPKSTSENALAIKNNESIAFLGDSITEYGANRPGGYVRLVISGLQANGVAATSIPAGVAGNKSSHMLERLERSVLSKKPNWMTLSCGVNDVWACDGKPIPLDEYKANMTTIVDQAQAAGVKVMILTATMITENQADSINSVKLASYNAFLRELAKKRNVCLPTSMRTCKPRSSRGSTASRRLITNSRSMASI